MYSNSSDDICLYQSEDLNIKTKRTTWNIYPQTQGIVGPQNLSLSLNHNEYLYDDQFSRLQYFQPIEPIKGLSLLFYPEFYPKGQQAKQGETKTRAKQKGLRRLSTQAFKIVRELKETSYKQVAVRLMKQYQQQFSKYYDEQQKQQSNIKRRVYDALNVLIAMEILQKKGRKIIYDPEKKINKQHQQLSKLRKEHRGIQGRIETKAKSRDNTKKSLEGASLFFKSRNKKQPKRRQKGQIKLPFLCMLTSNDQNPQFQISETSDLLQMKTKNGFELIGDMDFIGLYSRIKTEETIKIEKQIKRQANDSKKA